ncbi:MAG TPA: hypothetical protein PK313_11200, partial [Myxococcota bacterium]|nr:hypothetical protein [Myxococcota bacterium]
PDQAQGKEAAGAGATAAEPAGAQVAGTAGETAAEADGGAPAGGPSGADDASAPGAGDARPDASREAAPRDIAARPRTNRRNDAPEPETPRARAGATEGAPEATAARPDATPRAEAVPRHADAAPPIEGPTATASRLADAERPALATVTLNAEPWAEVRIDGRPVGTTPVVGVSVSAGRHRIEFVHPTLGVRVVEPTLAAGEKRTLRMRFTTGGEDGKVP